DADAYDRDETDQLEGHAVPRVLPEARTFAHHVFQRQRVTSAEDQGQEREHDRRESSWHAARSIAVERRAGGCGVRGARRVGEALACTGCCSPTSSCCTHVLHLPSATWLRPRSPLKAK